MTNYSRFVFKFIILILTFLLLLFGCAPKGKDFNIIYISLDTTRYDYIDTGKGARAYTPELRRYSERSIVFENVFSTSTQTLPSHLSVFTSHYPHELGVYTNDDKYEGRFKFISEVFEEQGYHTAAIISLGTLNSSTGTQNGFREFREDLFEEKIFFVPAEKITSEAIKTIQKLKKGRFFITLIRTHLMLHQKSRANLGLLWTTIRLRSLTLIKEQSSRKRFLSAKGLMFLNLSLITKWTISIIL